MTTQIGDLVSGELLFLFFFAIFKILIEYNNFIKLYQEDNIIYQKAQVKVYKLFAQKNTTSKIKLIVIIKNNNN